jgi:hypothetical protein
MSAKHGTRILILLTSLVLSIQCGDDAPGPTGSGGTGGSAGHGGSGDDGGTPGASGEGGQGAAGGAGPSPEEILTVPCTAFCEAVAEAMCPNDDPLEDCVSGCIFTGGFAEECIPLFQDWLSCSTTTDLECSPDGFAEATSCYDEEDFFTICIPI